MPFDDADLLNQNDLFLAPKPIPRTPKVPLVELPEGPVEEASGFASVAGAKRSQEDRDDGADKEWVGYSPNTVDRLKGDKAPAETVAKEAATGHDVHGHRVKQTFWGDRGKHDADIVNKTPEQPALFIEAGPQGSRKVLTAFEHEAKELRTRVRKVASAEFRPKDFATSMRGRDVTIRMKPVTRAGETPDAPTTTDWFDARKMVERYRFEGTGPRPDSAVRDMAAHMDRGADGAVEFIPMQRAKSTTTISEDPFARSTRWMSAQAHKFGKLREAKLTYALPADFAMHARALGVELPEDLAGADIASLFQSTRRVTNHALLMVDAELDAKAGQGEARERTDAMVSAREMAMNERWGLGRDAINPAHGIKTPRTP